MSTHHDKTEENKNQANADSIAQQQPGSTPAVQFVDNRPEAAMQKKLQHMANNNPQVQQLKAIQQMADNSPQVQQLKAVQQMADSGSQAVQKKTDTVTQPVPGAAEGIGVAQRLTISYTAADLLGGVDANPFANQVIQLIVYQRAAIPNPVKLAVVAFGDCPAAPVPVTYKHHVGHDTIVTGLKNVLEGETRATIVEYITDYLDVIGVDPATFGVNPMMSVAAFNSWVDSGFAAIADWPNNIFRGPSDGAALDSPTAPSAALTIRLTAAFAALDGLNFT
jgi:hypothetical protein